jgi:hypothetical protein
MEAHHQGRLQAPAMPPFAPLPPGGCKHDVHHLPTATAAAAMAVPGSNAATVTAAAADMAAYLQQLQDTAAAEANKQQSGGGGGAARGEQCPRCASHDTKFCYYNNYNTSQPRHFCRACRRYWTLGGSLRNVPIGGSTRKRPRLAHHHHHFQPPAARRAPAFGLGLGGAGGAPPVPPLPSSSSQAGGLLGSLFALGAAGPLLEGPAAPMLEGRGAGFDLGLGLPAGGPLGGGGGGPAGASSSGLFWPAGLLDNDSLDTWKTLPGAGVGAAMWPDFSAAAAAAPQTGGLLHGGSQLM